VSRSLRGEEWGGGAGGLTFQWGMYLTTQGTTTSDRHTRMTCIIESHGGGEGVTCY